MRSVVLGLGLLFACASAKVFFLEEFGEGWQERWVQSKHKSDFGKFVSSAGQFFGDEVRDSGAKTSQDARFYSISSRITEPFSNKEKSLVIQFSVKHEQKIDCGGGYLKIGPSTVDLEDFHGESVYNIMFGPDICGYTKRTHLILNYKGKNVLRTSDIRCESDELTHLYTLVLRSDQTYTVYIDQSEAASGNLLDDFAFLPRKQIPDPAVSKPSDWVDEAQIADPDDVKPEGWDDVPEFIVDPEAEKPADWDDEDDGEWEAPTIPNPEYKGEWTPKLIDNPAYKGEWVHPLIPNPDYQEDKSIYAFEDFGYVGIDIWQVKSGSIFDNIIITDDLDEAKAHADKTFNAQKKDERKKFDEHKEKKDKEAEAERAKRDAEIKALEAEESEDLDAGKEKHDEL